MYDVVILTDETLEQPSDLNWFNLQVLLEDAMVKSALEDEGLKVTRKAWSNPDFDWHQTRSVLFRSTWDYFDRFSTFKPWLEAREKELQIFNSAQTLFWNLDKRYLLDLATRAVNVVESEVIEAGSQPNLNHYFSFFDSQELIIKPVIAGGARHTHRFNRDQSEGILEALQPIINDETFLIQPFQPSVLTQGEISLMVMGGEYTHAVRKIAKPGDFRVQDDFGGTVEPYFPTAEEKAFAMKVVAACDPLPAYARVDIIRDRKEQLALMEVELIEPELFFRFHRAATVPLAKAIKKSLD